MKPSRITALSAAITFLGLSSWALAVTPTKIQSDLLQIGRGSSSADKTLEVNSNQGANNVKLVVPNATPQQLNVTTDTLKVGKSTAADKKIILDANAGAANPAIKWDNANGKLQFANNGVDFKSFGSGSGGGGGINLIQDNNPDFEAGTTGWTASGGSFTVATSGGNLLFGTRSGVFNASAASQTLTSTAITVTGAPAPGLAGGNGEVSCYFKTTATDYKLQAYDGSNVLAERTIGASTYAVEQGASFPIPASGTVAVRIISGSDATDLAVDDCYLGSLRTFQVSQAQMVGTSYFPATGSCNWTRNNSTPGAPGTVAACPGPTVESSPVGSWQTTDTDLPNQTINNLPPGRYEVLVSGSFDASGVGVAPGCIAVSDGITTSGLACGTVDSSGSGVFSVTAVGTFNYGISGNRTFQIFTTGNANTRLNNSSNSTTRFAIRYWPSEQQALTFDQASVFASAYHDNDCAWSTTSSTFVTPTDASCTFTQLINRNLALSSVAGIEPAITFTPPSTGLWKVTASLANFSNNTANQAANVKMVDGSGTLLDNKGAAANLATDAGEAAPTLTGELNVTSLSSAQTVRLQIAGSNGSNAATIHSPGAGLRTIKWTVQQIGWNAAAPLIVGGVVSPSSGVRNVTDLRVTNSGTPTILNQSGNWVTSLTDGGVGITTVNIAAGTFSGEPACTCTAIVPGTNNRECMFQSLSPSAISVRTSNGAADLDVDFSIICSGPK